MPSRRASCASWARQVERMRSWSPEMSPCLTRRESSKPSTSRETDFAGPWDGLRKGLLGAYFDGDFHRDGGKRGGLDGLVDRQAAGAGAEQGAADVRVLVQKRVQLAVNRFRAGASGLEDEFAGLRIDRVVGALAGRNQALAAGDDAVLLAAVGAKDIDQDEEDRLGV